MKLGKICKRRCRCYSISFLRFDTSQKSLALIIAELEGDDLILCQITSQRIKDKYAVEISDKDFETGGLRQTSNVRPNRIFTADSHIVLYRIGNLKKTKLNEIIEKVVEIIQK